MSAHYVAGITAHIDTIVTALRADGWLVLPDFLTPPQCEVLLADCKEHRGEFVAAAIGRGDARQQASDQRRDMTLWLRGSGSDSGSGSGTHTGAPQREFLQAMDFLRGELNRRLYLGLRDYEAHYAYYAPGAFYRRHRDAFAQAHAIAGSLKDANTLQAMNSVRGINTPQGVNAPQRILTSVVYLNTAEHGGELVLFAAENGRAEGELARIAPRAGTAVFFLSAEFPHEVLPAQSDRYSIAGWFRG